MTRVHRRQITILALFLVGILMVTSAALAQDVKTIFITEEVDAQNFPEISLTFRAVDNDNSVPILLTNDDIDVYENEQPVTDFEIGTPVNGPVYVIFVVDMGQWANFRGDMGVAVRDSMIQFTDGYFRDSIDTVAIMAQRITDEKEETVVLLEPTQSVARFTSAVNSLDLNTNSPQQTHGLLGVEAALNRLSKLSAPGNAGAAIIYISKLVELPQQSVAERDARTLAATSSEQFTKLYSFHTEIELGEPLQALAAGSGGEYIQLSATRDNSGNLNRVYQSIMAQGIRYPLSYRSQLGDSGLRNVIVVPSGTPAELVPQDRIRSYNISLQPPVIEIQEPGDNADFTREGTQISDGSWTYDRNSFRVTAEITSWPDGIDRDIESVTFFVNKVEQHSIPNPTRDSYSFNVDISDIEKPESLAIYVQVRDEFGLTAESDSITVNVDAQKVNPLPTPTPAPVPTPAPPIVINEDPCAQDSGSAACVLKYAPWGAIVILAVTMLAYRQKVAVVAGAAGGALRERVIEVKHTILGGGKKGKTVLAKLHVIVARRDLEGEEVKIYTNKTTIGRSPKLCDVLLYDEDEVSSVSGQHCTIQYDRGVFLITDDNSANGTLVNDQMLTPNNPQILNNGDEIILGDLFHRGAKLRFEIVQTAPEPSASDEPDSTRAGVETILDLAEEDFGTLYGDVDDSFPSSQRKDTDWFNDLE